MVKEFKDFVAKGNLVDLAVAFVLAAAFGKVIESFAKDIIGGIISYIGGDKVKDIESWKAGNLGIGSFISALINFLIIAFALYLVVKAYNRMRKTEEAGPSSTDKLLMEIRDQLARR